MSEEVTAKDNTFDPEFEEMLNKQIEKLDDMSKTAFQQVRNNITGGDGLSINERLLLTIEALERSQNYHEEATVVKEMKQE